MSVNKKLASGVVAAVTAAFLLYGSAKRYAPLDGSFYNPEDADETDEPTDTLESGIAEHPLSDTGQRQPKHDLIRWLHESGTLDPYYRATGLLDAVVHSLIDKILERAWMWHTTASEEEAPD